MIDESDMNCRGADTHSGVPSELETKSSLDTPDSCRGRCLRGVREYLVRRLEEVVAEEKARNGVGNSFPEPLWCAICRGSTLAINVTSLVSLETLSTCEFCRVQNWAYSDSENLVRIRLTRRCYSNATPEKKREPCSDPPPPPCRSLQR